MTPPRLPTATKADRLSDAMLREFAPNDNIVGWMATELLALRAAGDAMADVVEERARTGKMMWFAMIDAAHAWRTARGPVDHRCCRCGRRATVEVFNTYKAPIGYFCTPCGNEMVRRLNNEMVRRLTEVPR